MMQAAVAVLLILLFQVSSFAEEKKGYLKSWSAPSMAIGIKEPDELGEAAESYLVSVEVLREIERSKCGFALMNLKIPSFDDVVNKEIGTRVPVAQRAQYISVLKSWQKKVEGIAAAYYGVTFAGLVQDGGLDNNTACGWIAGTAVYNRAEFGRYLEKRRLTPK
jgi:hypothetical protein